MKTNEILIQIGIGVIAISIVIMAAVLILSKMGIDLERECQRQFEDCELNGGSLSYTECNCHPSIFSDMDCQECYKSSGNWCSYPNGSAIKCEVNMT